MTLTHLTPADYVTTQWSGGATTQLAIAPKGAVYADLNGVKGSCPAKNVQVKDTTGAGDAFCAGVAIGLTYGKALPEAIEIGSSLAASVISSSENVCPRFQPQELGLEIAR